jgi:hypothetical protein
MKSLFMWTSVAGIVLIAGVIYYSVQRDDTAHQNDEFHIHADLKVYINNKGLDLSLDRYQTGETHSGADNGHSHTIDMHIHDNFGSVLHLHAPGVSLGQFFETIGMRFTQSCFVLENAESYCNTEAKKLKMYVNGELEPELSGYVFSDLDKILITYGEDSEADILEQRATLTDDACIYSLTCPERGTPPPEECSGDGGCPVIY